MVDYLHEITWTQRSL